MMRGWNEQINSIFYLYLFFNSIINTSHTFRNLPAGTNFIISDTKRSQFRFLPILQMNICTE